MLDDYEDEEPIEKRFDNLCLDLCIETIIRDESWNKYRDVWANFSLEGDPLQWLVCSLYDVVKKNASMETGSGDLSEGSFVSLTRLLRTAKISLVVFFNRMCKWMDMTNMGLELRARLEVLERQFSVTTVVFKKLCPIFDSIFRVVESSASSASKSSVSMKRSKGGRHGVGAGSGRFCTQFELFNLCWTLFIQVKSHYPAICDDLVNVFHVLLCTVDWLFGCALLSGRGRDLLNPNFSGTPRDLGNMRAPPVDPLCILSTLCREHNGIFVETKTIKEHWFRPYLSRLFDHKVLKGDPDRLCGVLDVENFEASMLALNNHYEEFVLTEGDFDERVFLSANAEKEIGATNLKSPQLFSRAGCTGQLNVGVRRLLEKALRLDSSICMKNEVTELGHCGTAASGVVAEGDIAESLSRLKTLLVGRQVAPSDHLLALLQKHCQSAGNHAQLLADVEERLELLGGRFVECYACVNGEQNDEQASVGRKRLQLALSLYYLSLENLVVDEVNKMKSRLGEDALSIPIDLSSMLQCEPFHTSLLALCLEVVLLTYNCQDRLFPWIVESLQIASYHLYKIIESFIRCVELPREAVRHLQTVSESILEAAAWVNDSPLWASLASRKGRGPAVKEVMQDFRIDKADADKKEFKDQGHVLPKLDGLSLFYRHVYFLASLRLRDLCDRLGAPRDVLLRTWTVVESVLTREVELMRDRHVDQMLMCALYAVGKTLRLELPFTEVIKQYRAQPQSRSHIYRHVLLDIAKDEQVSDVSHIVESISKTQHGDLVFFYNSIFLPRVKTLVRTLGLSILESGNASSISDDELSDKQLCAIPDCQPYRPVSGLHASVTRRLHVKHNIYLSPCKAGVPALQKPNATPVESVSASGASASRRLYYVQSSQAKELKEINSLIQASEDRILASQAAAFRAAKRLYVHGLDVDGAGGPTAAKRLTFQQGQLTTTRRLFLEN